MTLKTGALLKYGPIINEAITPRIEVGMGASEVIAVKSGRFVVDDGSSRMEIAKDASALLSGWIELAENGFYTSTGIFTCSATENASKALFTPISACLGTVFRIPINSGTYAITMINNTCDLSVASNIQGAQLDASAEDTIIVVGGDLVNNEWVDVMPNPDKITGLTGVV